MNKNGLFELNEEEQKFVNLIQGLDQKDIDVIVTAAYEARIKIYKARRKEREEKAANELISNAIDSRDVAAMTEKQHAHLMRDIQKYAQTLTKSTQSKNGFSEFFIESTYKDNTGRTLPRYLLTRKGCEFVANKMTGEKGTLFTAAYINKFHEMEGTLQLTTVPTQVKAIPEKSTALDVKAVNAKTKLSNQLLKLSKLPALTDEQRKSCQLKAIEVLEN